MVHRHVMGREGMLVAIVMSLVMFATAFFADTPNTLAGNMGICLPSPNEWGLSPLWGWITNIILMTVVTVTLFLINKEFNFVQGSDTVLTGMFIIMASSNIWVTGTLSSTMLLALANLICLLVLFGCYRKRNSTQEMFVITTILSLGSMIQYAFIFMIPAYLIGAMLLKCFNFKSLIAFLMGIVAPYWVGVGLGIIPLEQFRMPTFTNLFDGYATKSGLFFGLLNVAVTVVMGLILALNNSVKLYAGNKRAGPCLCGMYGHRFQQYGSIYDHRVYDHSRPTGEPVRTMEHTIRNKMDPGHLCTVHTRIRDDGVLLEFEKMKIVADDNIPFLKGRLEKSADNIEVVYVDQWGFTPELVKDADALIIRTRTQCNETLLGGSKVRLVATATIGTDQIDLPWCAQNGIAVRNAPGCNAPGVAQYVWSCLLRMRFDPSHDILGIIGCGNVGSIVREWGMALGAKILVSDPPKEEAGICGEYVPLEELLGRSDAITLHTPLTKTGRHATHHLIGNRELSLIRDGKILVNAARGPVIDFNALKPHVTSGRIRAAIDTWENEPALDEELLEAVEYGTFHIAGYSRQGKERATRMALEAVAEVLGIEADVSGLEGAYTCTPGLSPEKITASYDPATDTAALREKPKEFDRLRRDYRYREEV